MAAASCRAKPPNPAKNANAAGIVTVVYQHMNKENKQWPEWTLLE